MDIGPQYLQKSRLQDIMTWSSRLDGGIRNILSNLENPEKWEFKHDSCHTHVEDEAVADLYEYDETVTYDTQAQYLGRIGFKKKGKGNYPRLITEGIPTVQKIISTRNGRKNTSS